MAKIKNLTKAANRVKKAIAQRERIVLYGDADMDGVTSVLIADEAIKSLGGNVVAYYFPEREKEGYGVTPKALEYLKQYAPALLVTFDLGISNFKVRDTRNRERGAFRLLSCTSVPKGKKMVEQFVEKNRLRREEIARVADEVRMRIFHKKSDALVFEGSEQFEFMLLGAVASIISQETQKPAFIYKKRREGLLGSIRAPLGYDTVKAMQHCSEFLDVYGGHPQAAGFQTTSDKEEGLHVCLTEYFQKNK